MSSKSNSGLSVPKLKGNTNSTRGTKNHDIFSVAAPRPVVREQQKKKLSTAG